MLSALYLRTDLAVENPNLHTHHSGISISQQEENEVTILTVDVQTDDAARHIMRPVGRYITLSFAPFWNGYESIDATAIQTVLSHNLKTLLSRQQTPKRVLVIGLGNRAITADAVGPLAVEQIDVTGHFENNPVLKPYLPPCSTFALSPGVVGKTGIETLSIIQAAVKSCSADLAIAIDSLAARSTERLGCSIQLSNTGIIPGSGIGNHRKAIDQSTLGIPVIAIGVPLVVSSATLICDALETAGIESISQELTEILENRKSFFVTLKESDLATALLAKLIANSVNSVIANLT